MLWGAAGAPGNATTTRRRSGEPSPDVRPAARGISLARARNPAAFAQPRPDAAAGPRLDDVLSPAMGGVRPGECVVGRVVGPLGARRRPDRAASRGETGHGADSTQRFRRDLG